MLRSAALPPLGQAPDTRTIVSISAVVAAIVFGAVAGIGVAVVPLAILSCVAFGGAVVAANRAYRAAAAFVIVVLTAAIIDGLPGPQLSPGSANAVFVPMVLLPPALLIMGWRHLPAVPKSVLVMSAALLFWCTLEFGRAIIMGAPARDMAFVGRDFTLFAILLPLYTSAFLDRRVRSYCIIGFALLAAWTSAVNIAAALHVLPFTGYFAHGYRLLETGNIGRVFSMATELSTAAIPFALAAVLLAPRAWQRRIAVALLVLGVTEMFLGLTRVKYLGMAVGLSVVLVVGARGSGAYRAAVLLIGAVIIGWIAAHAGPLQLEVQTMTQRISTIFDANLRQSVEGYDTAAYREAYAARIRSVLTTQDWIMGRGFLPAPFYYFAPDSAGLLRNADLGWYNALTTMGLVGVFLVFLPVANVIARTLLVGDHSRSFSWYVVGGLGWSVYALSVSPTLIVLFSPEGLTIAAAVLGTTLAVTTDATKTTDAPPEEKPPTSTLSKACLKEGVRV